MNIESPRHQQITRELDRQERFPWLLLTRVFKAAVRPQILLLAVVGAVATTAGWRLLDAQLLQTADKIEFGKLETDCEHFSKWPGQRVSRPDGSLNGMAPLSKWIAPISHSVCDWFGPPPDDPVFSIPYRLVGAARGAAMRGTGVKPTLYYLGGGLWTLLVWSGFGMAITRMAARLFARDDVVDLFGGMKFAQAKIPSCLAAVLGPIAGLVLLGLPMVLLGGLMRWDSGALIAGLLWVLTIPLGIVMAIIALGHLFGWPLLWGAIATESSDAFDAVSRSYSYTFQRPLHYLAYAALAAVLGILGWVVVWMVSEFMVNIGLWCASLTAGAPRLAELLSTASDPAVPMSAAPLGGRLLTFWNGLIRSLASGFGYSYFWCAIAAIYFLLRQQVDGAELDQIELLTEKQHGLPNIESIGVDAPLTSS